MPRNEIEKLGFDVRHLTLRRGDVVIIQPTTELTQQEKMEIDAVFAVIARETGAKFVLDNHGNNYTVVHNENNLDANPDARLNIGALLFGRVNNDEANTSNSGRSSEGTR